MKLVGYFRAHLFTLALVHTPTIERIERASLALFEFQWAHSDAQPDNAQKG